MFTYTFVLAPVEEVKLAWRQFQATDNALGRASFEVSFIPAAGGCFIIASPKAKPSSWLKRLLFQQRGRAVEELLGAFATFRRDGYAAGISEVGP